MTWNGKRFSLLGGALVNGCVHASLAVGPVLFVTGDFLAVGEVSAHGLASFDMRSRLWSAAHLGAVGGGQIGAMIWWRNSLVVAGSFTEIGRSATTAGLPASGLARWEDGRWKALQAGPGKGQIFALASSDDALYVGGSFASLGDSQGPLVAVYRGDRLEPLLAAGDPPVAGRCGCLCIARRTYLFLLFIVSPCVPVLSPCEIWF
jgi:hypothetical protein